ncbi:hypothetical protein [Streptomyces californicus]|uniref:hypothetical protein n=1 Tax=Streptomyces californicus TaxID=67351 RepID=UPI003796A4EB
MTAFTSRRTLRGAVLAAVAAGAVLVPSAAAFADSSPKPVASAPAASAPSPERSEATSAAPKEAAPATAPRGGVAAGEAPTPAPKAAEPEVAAPATAPRGGVAAGERPAAEPASTAVLAGSAVGAVLLAGAGTIVLRRRSAAGHTA